MTAPRLLLVRLRRGVVGESRRVVHIVAFPDGEEIPESLTAYCGELILRGTAEALTKPCGMPCTLCLWRAPLPPPPSELPAGA